MRLYLLLLILGWFFSSCYLEKESEDDTSSLNSSNAFAQIEPIERLILFQAKDLDAIELTESTDDLPAVTDEEDGLEYLNTIIIGPFAKKEDIKEEFIPWSEEDGGKWFVRFDPYSDDQLELTQGRGNIGNIGKRSPTYHSPGVTRALRGGADPVHMWGKRSGIRTGYSPPRTKPRVSRRARVSPGSIEGAAGLPTKRLSRQLENPAYVSSLREFRPSTLGTSSPPRPRGDRLSKKRQSFQTGELRRAARKVSTRRSVSATVVRRNDMTRDSFIRFSRDANLRINALALKSGPIDKNTRKELNRLKLEFRQATNNTKFPITRAKLDELKRILKEIQKLPLSERGSKIIKEILESVERKKTRISQ